jgi:hypothetical protein
VNLRGLLKGAVGPRENDSRYLLDVHSRAIPGRERMRRYRDDEQVDLCIVGAGAGGSVLAQRLARRGWKIVILEAGPFWDPDADWVSDEAGSHELYWNEPRVIGGADPVELGKNNCGRGVGGSMVHYAGYAPRFHPSDFEIHTRDGVGVDWPLAYQELQPHYQEIERELPVSGQDWPWGDPHSYPFSPHPISGAAAPLWKGARKAGIAMRVGPVAIVNGTFGNRPHCIYRGYCLQGCKVNAKGSPYVSHLPDAIEPGVEVRAGSMAARETLRLLLNSTSRRFPNGLGNGEDQVGRYVMVQGATQTAGRFGEELRSYKAPPPEVSSEQFYETDPSRGFARGFSIQTVSPLPIGWAEHVVAGGHWGRALREYMRDYNHWATIGVLNELLPHPENRVTLADDHDRWGLPVARMDYSVGDNDRRNMEFSTKVITGILHAAGAQDVLTIMALASRLAERLASGAAV